MAYLSVTSEELYRTLVANFPNGAVLVFDAELRYTLADGIGLADVGLSKDALEGKTIWELFPPDLCAVLAPHYRAALAGQASAFEVPFGGRLHLVHTRPIRDASGAIFAGMAMTQDITERKRAEEALRASEARHRALLNAIPDLMFRISRDGTYLDFRAERSSNLVLPPDRVIGNNIRQMPIAPELIETMLATIRAALDTGQMTTLEYSLETPGGWRDFESRNVASGPDEVVAIVQDITERKRAQQQLQEKEAQYRGIFEATSDGLFINDLETGQMVDFNPAAAHMHGYTVEEFRALQPPQFIHPDSLHLFDEYMQAVKAGRRIRTRAVDVRKDGSLLPVEVLGTPFTYRGRPATLGVVRDVTEQERAYQLLEQRVAERTRELSALLEIAHSVGSTLELGRLLALILDRLKSLVDYTGAAIYALEGGWLTLLDERGLDEGGARLPVRLAPDAVADLLAAFRRGEPVIVADAAADTAAARALRPLAGAATDRAWLGVPLRAQERVIGALCLCHAEPDFYTERHANLALAIANQAAVAIENARLYQQAQSLAALEERQRLARELHDSVSQAIYGIALGARTARTQLDRDPARAAEPLDYVLSLAEAGLAEMRALIFELRPESLRLEGLVAALSKQAASVRARHHLEVDLDLGEEPELPLDTKEALYRIGQEALHNAVKHARARRLALCLKHTNTDLILEIRDDGVGFDASGAFPGHLGLRSMRERAARVGGRLVIDSAPGQGSCISVQIPYAG